MKKKILLTILLGIILTYVIYKQFYHEQMNIVALGDSLALGMTAYNVKGYSYNDYLRDYYEENSIVEEYITEFANEEETTETLILKLQNNYTLESTELSITQAIAKAKILTIALGMNELSSKKELTSSIIDKYISNMDKILKMVRIYNKKEIILLGFYENEKISGEKLILINEALQELCQKYEIKFISLEELNLKQEYFFDSKKLNLNYKGHRYISEKLIKIIN